MRFILLLSSVFFSKFTFAQVPEKSNTDIQKAQGKKAAIDHIKQVYRQSNDYRGYKVVAIEESEDFLGHATDNGGSLKGYFKGDSLKKIVEWVGLSNRVIENEYYFDNNKLVFVYSKESNYRFNNSTQSFDYTKLDNAFTGRYYFRNEKLIETIIPDKSREKTKQEDAQSFLSSVKEYIKLLSKNKK